VRPALSDPAQASLAGRISQDLSLARPSAAFACMKLHHPHLMEADRIADHPGEDHQLGMEVDCRTAAAAEEARHIAAEVVELRTAVAAVAAVADLDPVVRVRVSLVLVLSYSVSKKTHIVSWLCSLRVGRLRLISLLWRCI